MKTVEIQIQFQNIHARFAKESEVAALCMSLDKCAHVFFFHATRMSNARNLEFCSRRRDVWVQTRPRGCHQVDRDRSIRIFYLKLLYVTLYALKQILVGRR